VTVGNKNISLRGTLKHPLVFWLVFGGVLLWLFSSKPSICSQSLEYSIGEFDSQFGITQNNFLQAAQSAEKMWEDAVGHDLFNYVEGSPFKINLVYGGLQKKYNELIRYNHDIKSYNQRLESYNRTVDYWNARGGAPDNIYYSLQSERQALLSLERQLDLKNLLVENIEGDELQGLYDYDANEISVFMMADMGDLKVTLAHEFGHALTSEHSPDSTSVMYYTEGVPPSDMRVTEEDVAKVKNICGF